MIARFSGHGTMGGVFRLWNARFRSVVKTDSHIDVHLESDDLIQEDDLDDPHSFLLVADWLATGNMREYLKISLCPAIFSICIHILTSILAEVFFWPTGELEECYNLHKMRSEDFERALKVSGLKSKSDITMVSVSMNGMIRVKNEQIFCT